MMDWKLENFVTVFKIFKYPRLHILGICAIELNLYLVLKLQFFFLYQLQVIISNLTGAELLVYEFSSTCLASVS